MYTPHVYSICMFYVYVCFIHVNHFGDFLLSMGKLELTIRRFFYCKLIARTSIVNLKNVHVYTIVKQLKKINAI